MSVVHLAADGVNGIGEMLTSRTWCGLERGPGVSLVLAPRHANCQRCHEVRRKALPDMIRVQVERAAKNRLRRKHAKDLARLRGVIAR